MQSCANLMSKDMLKDKSSSKMVISLIKSCFYDLEKSMSKWPPKPLKMLKLRTKLSWISMFWTRALASVLTASFVMMHSSCKSSLPRRIAWLNLFREKIFSLLQRSIINWLISLISSGRSSKKMRRTLTSSGSSKTGNSRIGSKAK